MDGISGAIVFGTLLMRFLLANAEDFAITPVAPTASKGQAFAPSNKQTEMTEG